MQRNKVLLPNNFKTKTKLSLKYEADDDAYLIKDDEIYDKDNQEEVNLAQLRKETEFLSSFIKSEFSYGSKMLSKTVKRQFEEKLQIIYCWRTHSQISQIISEINKLPKLLENIVVVPLSSRKITWINPSANPLDKPVSTHIVNDRWKGLLETNKWIYNQIGELQVESLSNKITSTKLRTKVMDIEDIVSYGKSTVTCPYFAIRNSIYEADIIVLPYQSILHQETRKQIGLELENRIILFDEAHNVFESINQMNECIIDLNMISSSIFCLK